MDISGGEYPSGRRQRSSIAELSDRIRFELNLVGNEDIGVYGHISGLFEMQPAVAGSLRFWGSITQNPKS
jgi:hypothetical protein